MSHNRSIVGLERGGGVNNAGAGGERAHSGANVE